MLELVQVSNMSNDKPAENKNSFIVEDSKGEPFVEKPEAKKEPGQASGAVLKLLLIAGIGYGAYTYGLPLANNYAKKLNKPSAEEHASEVEISKIEVADEEVNSNKQASARISKGYESWEPEVKQALGKWLNADESTFRLTHISVHKSGNPMEIRYVLLDGDQEIAKSPIYLNKDGFGERFVYKKDGKEFIVYPPR